MILQNNLTLLSQRNGQLASLLYQNHSSAHLNLIHDNGYYNLQIMTERGMAQMYQDGILEQVKQDAGRLDLTQNKCSVLLGFDLGYLAKEINEQMEKGHMLLIIERDIAMLKLAFSVIDFSSLIKNIRVMFLAGNDVRIDRWIPKMSTRFVNRSINIIHSNISMALHTEYYTKLKKVINDSANSIQVNANTIMNSGRRMAYNNIKNIPAILESRGVKVLQNRFANIPAIVVGAGPSLDKNVHLLKKIQDKVVIIASDSVLKKLLGIGIKPHFVCCIDFLEDNYKKKFERCSDSDRKETLIPSDIGLIYNQTCFWKTPIAFDKSRRFAIQISSKISQWISRIFTGDLGTIEAGQTVTHMAFNAGNYMGCNPIILIGQDLSFPDKTTDHASGCSTWKTEGNQLIEEKNIYGDTVYTIVVFLSMKHIFENKIKDCDRTVINATGGGLNIIGTKNMSLKDAIAKYVDAMSNIPFASASNRQRTGKEFDIRAMMPEEFLPAAPPGIQWTIKELAYNLAVVEDDCKKIYAYLNMPAENKFEPQEAINRLRLKQETINLLEDISTDVTLFMTQQDTIDCDKIEDKETRIKKQRERALKYYKTIGDNAGFFKESFGEVIK
jgi:hypothetical protein